MRCFIPSSRLSPESGGGLVGCTLERDRRRSEGRRFGYRPITFTGSGGGGEGVVPRLKLKIGSTLLPLFIVNCNVIPHLSIWKLWYVVLKYW